jgi:hypothetical protein
MSTEKQPSSSGAGPTPFHPRSSYIQHDDVERRPLFKWHIYDNKGSYNGWFDWLPEWMRVGYWSPIAVASIICFYSAVCLYMPHPLEFPVTRTTDLFWCADVAIFAWGVFVVVHARISLGSINAFYISYTGWSWFILTARAGLTAAAPLVESSFPSLAASAATLGSSLRFPTVVAATITFTIWNFVLLPIIYFKATPPGEPRERFLRFNFSFFMTNVHVLNLPLALVNTIFGDGARIFRFSDLWVGYLVVMLYSMVYLLVLDRLGLHFYPFFCPRSAACGLSMGLVVLLYYCLYLCGNELIVHLQPALVQA